MKVAIVGGGPSSLFILKRLVEMAPPGSTVDIFEKKSELGRGMPYGPDGALDEHITNVSSSELPELPDTLVDWVKSLGAAELEPFKLDPDRFHEDRVLPRLLFGRYLQAQFERLLTQAEARGLQARVHLGTHVEDVRDLPDEQQVLLRVGGQKLQFDRVVVCSGHHWPARHEGKVPGYFDSPYPPSKLAGKHNHAVALRGSSLTAVDAVRTLSRQHGRFEPAEQGLRYMAGDESPDFKLVLHTRNGLLPCLRFHLEDPQVGGVGLMSQEQIQKVRGENDGFVPLDLVFEEYFKEILREKDPEMYEQIRYLGMEEVVEAATRPREEADSFDYFKAEYREALESQAKRKSIAWKEVLAILSFAINYPAKYFSAEDMGRLRKTLLPLISIVIAFIPRSSAEELLALHAAGRLELLEVGSDSRVEPREEGGATYHFENGKREYETFVDCIGQPQLDLESFPFQGLIEQGVISRARIAFRSPKRGQEQLDEGAEVERDEEGRFYLLVSGMAISDHFQPVDRRGQAHPRIFMMAVPFMGGHNPDYSGLDFCEEASQRIVEALCRPSGQPLEGELGIPGPCRPSPLR